MFTWKKVWAGIFILVLLAALFPSLAFANEGEVGYSVRAVIPDNQIDKNISYFDLLMEPGQKQKIQVEVFNSSNKDTEIDIHITNAVTNRNGLIDYTNLEPVLDESLLYPMTEIATVMENTIYVPAKQTKVVTIQLKMPKEEFAGIILGGIYFEKRMSRENGNPDSIQIANKCSYVLGLKLTEMNTEIKPDLYLKSVKPDLVNYRTTMIAKIQNRAPVIVDDLEICAKIFDKKGKELFERNVDNYRMAPNSSLDFMIDLENNKLLPGDYNIKIHANSENNQWEWEQAFTIEKGEANQLNKTAVQTEKDNNYLIYVIAVCLFIILILIVVNIQLRKRNKELK